MAREITTRTERIWLGEDGIVRSIHLPGAEQTLADAVENLRAVEALLPQGRRSPILVDSRGLASMTREARAYYAGPELARLAVALAIVGGSPVSRMIGSFFLRLSRPAVPTRLCTDEADALAWLRGYLP